MSRDNNACAEEEWNQYLGLVADADLLQKIHKSKKCFQSLFTELANRIMKEKHEEWHTTSKGAKVSQGNSLQFCPYQVLDIVRDFNAEAGLNIRLLNWWGRGIYIFVYLGRTTAHRLLKQAPNRLTNYLVDQRFYVSMTASPWDYKGMVDQEHAVEAQSSLDWINIIDRVDHIQLFKKLHFENTPLKTQSVLLEEIIMLGEILKKPR